MPITQITTSDNIVDVNTEERLTFKEGLYAFENYKHFYLLELNEDNIFQILQSEDDKDVAFIVINPYLFKRDYILNVRESDLADIGIMDLTQAKEKLAVFSIVTTNEETMTANLLGPIIINTQTKQARQALDLNENYTTKHNILEEIQIENISEVTSVSAG